MNHGPLDLQSNALPLSYTPTCSKTKIFCFLFRPHRDFLDVISLNKERTLNQKQSTEKSADRNRKRPFLSGGLS